jgi:hypothetical protein
MTMNQLRFLLLSLFVVLTLVMTGCGGSSSGPNPVPGTADSDGDGIPNADDAFPNDPTRFADYKKVPLAPLAAGHAAYAVAVNDDVVPLVAGLALTGANIVKAVTWVAMENPPSPLQLNALAADNTLASAAYGVNSDGIVVGEAENGTTSLAVYWPADALNPTPLSMAGMTGTRSAAFAINTANQIVGEAEQTAGIFVPVLWNGLDAAPAELPLGSAATGSVYYINDGGWIAGEVGGKAAYWTVNAEGTVADAIELPLLVGHVAGVALGVDGAGRFVGESEADNGTVYGVAWLKNSSDAYVPTNLGPASAQAINDNNRIAGYGAAGSASRAAVWDTRLANPTNFTAVLDKNSLSHAYGINQSDVIVGAAEHQAFVALPE